MYFSHLAPPWDSKSKSIVSAFLEILSYSIIYRREKSVDGCWNVCALNIVICILPWLHISCGRLFGTLEKTEKEKIKLTSHFIKISQNTAEESKHYPAWIMTLSSCQGGMKKQEVHSNSTECLFCGQTQISSAVRSLTLPNVSCAFVEHWIPTRGLIHYSERLWHTLKDWMSVLFGAINFKTLISRVYAANV